MDTELKLSPEAIESLRILVNFPAWSTFFLPSLKLMRENWNLRLIDRSQKRKDEWNDDYIGGCISTLDVILSMPEALLGEADEIEHRKEQERREAVAYAQRAATGRMGPYINPDAMPTIAD